MNEEKRESTMAYTVEAECVHRTKTCHLRTGAEGQMPAVAIGPGGKIPLDSEALKRHMHDLECFVDGARGQDKLLRLIVKGLDGTELGEAKLCDVRELLEAGEIV